ncbi:MAG: hypothetical protein ACLGHP_01330, partial [Vicinamibacteria bacterium]
IDPADMTRARAAGAPSPWAPPADGRFHICYVGTALPLGHGVLRAFFDGISRLRETDPGLAARLRLRFVGTSNEARPDAAARVRPLAADAGVADLVDEHPPRVPFYDALRVLDRAGAILLAGTSEARYTASKLHAALAAGRPVLALFHERSDVSRVLAPIAAREPSVRLLTYGDDDALAGLGDGVADVVRDWLAHPPASPEPAAFPESEGPALAARLAALLDEVVERRG